MANQYFYTDGIDVCAGCGKHLTAVAGLGIVQLTAPGNPLLYYPACRSCGVRTMRDSAFAMLIGQRAIMRARELGAFGLPVMTSSEKGVGK